MTAGSATSAPPSGTSLDEALAASKQTFRQARRVYSDALAKWLATKIIEACAAKVLKGESFHQVSNRLEFWDLVDGFVDRDPLMHELQQLGVDGQQLFANKVTTQLDVLVMSTFPKRLVYDRNRTLVGEVLRFEDT